MNKILSIATLTSIIASSVFAATPNVKNKVGQLPPRPISTNNSHFFKPPKLSYSHSSYHKTIDLRNARIDYRGIINTIKRIDSNLKRYKTDGRTAHEMAIKLIKRWSKYGKNAYDANKYHLFEMTKKFFEKAMEEKRSEINSFLKNLRRAYSRMSNYNKISSIYFNSNMVPTKLRLGFDRITKKRLKESFINDYRKASYNIYLVNKRNFEIKKQIHKLDKFRYGIKRQLRQIYRIKNYYKNPYLKRKVNTLRRIDLSLFRQVSKLKTLKRMNERIINMEERKLKNIKKEIYRNPMLGINNISKYRFYK